MAVSIGEKTPTLVITNTNILDVFTGETFKGNIWVYKHWIAYVGEKKPDTGPETIVIEAPGSTLVPGYIDAHGHADLFYNPATFGDCVLTKGSTTVYSDGHDMINSIGVQGFKTVLSQSDAFSIKYLWGVPAAYPPYPDIEGGELYSTDEIRDLFVHYPDCVAISELSPYMRILKNEERILRRIFIARSLGKNVEGHTLGASYDRLNTLVAAGITSCHESIRAADVRNRVRLGLYTMIRNSSIRSDFPELCPVVRTLPNDRIILVTDGIFAHDLLSKGYMDYVVREAIRNGIDPVDAIRMATINPARYFKLDGELGCIAPGRVADILLLDNLHEPTPRKVIERGRLVAEDGRLSISPSSFPDVGVEYNPYRFVAVDPSEFAIPASESDTAPVIEIVDRTVTKKNDLLIEKEGGMFVASRKNDIRKIFYTRRERKAWGKGFLKGFGARIGGIASSIAHETHGLLVTGFEDSDMARAANEVLGMGGGIVLADKGNIIHRFSLSYGATMSSLPVKELAGALKKLNGILREMGSELDDPLWTMGFLTFTSIVELRITPLGVYDVKKGEIIF